MLTDRNVFCVDDDYGVDRSGDGGHSDEHLRQEGRATTLPGVDSAAGVALLSRTLPPRAQHRHHHDRDTLWQTRSSLHAAADHRAPRPKHHRATVALPFRCVPAVHEVK